MRIRNVPFIVQLTGHDVDIDRRYNKCRLQYCGITVPLALKFDSATGVWEAHKALKQNMR